MKSGLATYGYFASTADKVCVFFLGGGGKFPVRLRTKTIATPCWRWLNLCQRSSVALSERIVGKPESSWRSTSITLINRIVVIFSVRLNFRELSALGFQRVSQYSVRSVLGG